MLDAASTGKTRFMEPTLTRASERSRARGKREGRAAPASSRAAARCLGERRPSQRPLKRPYGATAADSDVSSASPQSLISHVQPPSPPLKHVSTPPWPTT